MSDQNTSQVVKPEGPWVAHALKPGHTIMEYVVEKTLGGGGFGITYLARDGNLNLPVAIKEYLPTDLAMRAGEGSVQVLSSALQDQFHWGLERFLEEARVLATFRHPNIVRALRYFPANGTAYIVMEFESGESLKKWLPRQNALNQSTLLQLIHPLLDGLEIIHNAGFLHRDIKPDNIYIRSDNTPVLIDFGSARNTNSDRDLTSIVSPGFAPFEQYQSKGNQGPWTDLYSLAAVMYWMVTGQKPPNSIERMKQDALVPATQLDPNNLLGELLLSTIDWALNTDETRRPQTVAEFRNHLQKSTGKDSSALIPEKKFAIATTWDVTVSSAKNIAGVENQGSNLVCSILFLDIVAYSKTSVNEQYQLKSSFNQLIAGKLAHVPESGRITLDTGDGAVICFMGDPEEVLEAARDIQRTLVQQDRLQVRMGLHIGPIRIINDLNGHKNVIGDGINVGQRVMSFADSNALVVSRAFYEIVACITDGAERGFSYIGERRDKHDRIHEIYAVITGNASERTDERTILLNKHSTSEKNCIDPNTIARIEKELTHHLGPLAPVLIRKIKLRVASEAELRNQLALSISDPAQREIFLHGATGNSQNNDNSSTHVNTAPSQKFTNSGPVSASKPVSHSISEPGASIRPWLAPESIALLEKNLAKAIGPLARMLIKKEVRNSESLSKLCTALSLHIDNLESRKQFLKDTSSLLKSGL